VSTKTPIFVLGYPRSGTTLLRALLGSHSKVHLVNEPDLVRGLITSGYSVSDTIKKHDLSQLLEQLRKVGACRQHLTTLTTERLSAFVSSNRDLTFKEVFEFLLPKPEGALVWGEKSLGNVFYMKELHQLYPNALFVHIIRDPRSALLSHYRKKFAHADACEPSFDLDGIRFFTHGVFLWKQWVDAVRDARASLGKHVVIQLRYRELVTKPEKQLRRICQAIGIEFESDMLEVSKRRDDPVLKSQSPGAYAHRNLAEPINADRVRTHEELPAWAAYIVEKHLRHELSQLGYQLRQDQAGLLRKLCVDFEMLLTEKAIRSKVDHDVAVRRGLEANSSSRHLQTH
jgi:hypothetical protein